MQAAHGSRNDSKLLKHEYQKGLCILILTSSFDLARQIWREATECSGNKYQWLIDSLGNMDATVRYGLPWHQAVFGGNGSMEGGTC